VNFSSPQRFLDGRLDLSIDEKCQSRIWERIQQFWRIPTKNFRVFIKIIKSRYQRIAF